MLMQGFRESDDIISEQDELLWQQRSQDINLE